MITDTILIIGANGQIGTVLTKELQNRYGVENIIGSSISPSFVPVVVKVVTFIILQPPKYLV